MQKHPAEALLVYVLWAIREAFDEVNGGADAKESINTLREFADTVDVEYRELLKKSK